MVTVMLKLFLYGSKTVDYISIYANICIVKQHEREKTMFDKDGNYYPNDDELNEFEESEETE